MKKKYQNPEMVALDAELEQIIATSPGDHLDNGTDEDAGVKSRNPQGNDFGSVQKSLW